MRTSTLACVVALCGCGSGVTAPGPGRPEDVRSVRLFDGAGQEQTNHVYLYRSDTVHLEVRMFAGDGHQITTIPGGVTAAFAFVPDSVAQSVAMPAQPLRRAVSTTVAAGTDGTLFVSLLFLADSSSKVFGPFQCLVHP